MNTWFGRLTATALGAGAVAVAVLTLSAPAQATSFHDLCLRSPENYGDGAVRGVFSTEKHGLERWEVCRVYDEKDYLRGTHHEVVYRFDVARPLAPTAVLSQ